MVRILFMLWIVTLFVQSNELVVVADKNFPLDSLNKDEIKSFFLNKKSLIKKKSVLVMNHKYENEMRRCFEKVILHKTKKSLERYWRKAYYRGHRPPKVIESTSMLLSYLNHVTPAIGYMDSEKFLGKELKVLYSCECP